MAAKNIRKPTPEKLPVSFVDGLAIFHPLVLIFLASVTSVAFLYKIFFIASRKIWSMNLVVDPFELTPSVRPWAPQHDGLEVYVLYSLAFASILISYFIFFMLRKLLTKGERKKVSLYSILIFCLACVSYVFLSKIGFHPPMAKILNTWWIYPLAIFGSAATWFIFKFLNKFEKILNLTVLFLALPVCFVATTSASLFDYSFVFSPALRMITGANLSEIYFQYDFMLSLLAMVWMKLRIDLNHFQILGQFSVYLFLISSYFFSRRLFIKKELSLYLLLALVIIKVYGLICDPAFVIQATPLRLDWWLLLAIVVHEKGFYSKHIGIVLGLLVITHRTFGIIYTISYIEAGLILMLIEFYRKKGKINFATYLKQHILKNLFNFAFIVLSLIIAFLVFGFSLGGASIYQKIGIGFMPISPASFYWLIFVMLSVASVYLVTRWKMLSDNYLITSIFIITLAIGNSIYFFGRSHENNIINIAGPLVFVLFILFDLISKQKASDQIDSWTFQASSLLSTIFIGLLLVYYSSSVYPTGGLSNKLATQFKNLREGRLIYPAEATFDLTEIKKLTNNSQKLFFVGTHDFYYYYYGNYVPKGYFSPYTSWVYKKDLVNFLQNLINDGYYIVKIKDGSINPDKQNEILDALMSEHKIETSKSMILWR